MKLRDRERVFIEKNFTDESSKKDIYSLISKIDDDDINAFIDKIACVYSMEDVADVNAIVGYFTTVVKAAINKG